MVNSKCSSSWLNPSFSTCCWGCSSKQWPLKPSLIFHISSHLCTVSLNTFDNVLTTIYVPVNSLYSLTWWVSMWWNQLIVLYFFLHTFQVVARFVDATSVTNLQTAQSLQLASSILHQFSILQNVRFATKLLWKKGCHSLERNMIDIQNQD